MSDYASKKKLQRKSKYQKSCRHSSMKGNLLRVEHKQDWKSALILLLIQAAVLRGSGAGSDGVEPVSGFVIKNHQTTCSR